MLAVAHKYVTVSARTSARFGELQALEARSERDRLVRSTATTSITAVADQ